MSKRVVSLLFTAYAILFLGGCVHHRQNSNNSGSELDVRVNPKENFQVEISIINRSSKPIAIRTCDLPWKYPHAFIVKAVRINAAGTMLEEQLPIADKPVVDPLIIIDPGEQLRGMFDLAGRFPELAENAKNQELLFFWYFELPATRQNDKQHFGGYFIYCEK